MIHDFRDEYWIVGAVATTIFECAWALRGFERLLADFMLDPTLAERVLDLPYHYHLAVARRLVGLGVDMIQCGDDVGTQTGMLMSPDAWRRFLRSRLAGFIADLKSRDPDLKVAYHSDGAVHAIVPDLIEIGVDVLNPIQPACMDPAALRKEYRERLCFWGTIDEQHTLPFGTSEEVRDEVRSRLTNVGRGGGLILGPTHNVQLDTPLENFWAMVEAVRGE
jgi:uroporphyrinogen-III decarboxylase